MKVIQECSAALSSIIVSYHTTSTFCDWTVLNTKVIIKVSVGRRAWMVVSDITRMSFHACKRLALSIKRHSSVNVHAWPAKPTFSSVTTCPLGNKSWENETFGSVKCPHSSCEDLKSVCVFVLYLCLFLVIYVFVLLLIVLVPVYCPCSF